MERNALIALLSILAAFGAAWLVSRRRHRQLSRLAIGLTPGAPAAGAQNLPPACEDDCIDWPTVWTNLEGDHSLLSELAVLFLDALPSELQAIHHAVDKKLGHELERTVHRLKGGVGNFAAKPAFDAASQLEDIARSGDWERVPATLETLEHEIQRLEYALREWTNNPDQNGVAGQLLASPPAAGSSAGSGA